MSAAERRRVPALRIVAIVLGSILLLGLGTVLYIRHGIDRRWAAMEARFRDLHAQVAGRGLHRPVLRGEPVPGDARADYDFILSECDRLKSEGAVLDRYNLGLDKVDRTELDAALVWYAPSIEALRRAAGRDRFTSLVERDGDPAFYRGGGGLGQILQMALYQARKLRESGRLREAAELLLDTLRVEADLAIPEQSFRELGLLLQSPSLGVEESRLIDRGLEILDGDFPRLAQSLDRQLFLLGTAVLRSRGGETSAMEHFASDDPKPGWREFFSRRLMELHAFETIDRDHAEIQRWESLPWTEAHRLREEMNDTRADASNDLVAQFQIERSDSDLPYRAHRAQLRLQRVAAHYRATGEILDLADPFGVRLTTRKTASGLLISSIGDKGTKSFDLIEVDDENPNGKLRTNPLELEVPH